MKKFILSAATLFALSFTFGVMAQDTKPEKQAEKEKTECCKAKEKKEGCCKSDKENKKSCCSEKKSADDKSTADKK